MFEPLVARTLRASAVAALIVLSACASQPTEQAGLADGYTASGQEPGWHARVDDDVLTLTSDYGEKTFTAPIAGSKTLPNGVQYVAHDATQSMKMSVRQGESVCHDTMSGMPYPDHVRVQLGDETLQGCGGDPATLLTQNAWQVSALNGKPVTAHAPTLQFAADGSANGFASCNRWMGQYVLSGEGLSIRQPATTLMLCQDDANTQEQQFLAALEAVIGFDINAADALVLRTADGDAITAIRKPDADD